MRIEQILDETLDLLQHPEFKNFGDLQKSRFQNSKSEDEIFLRSDMYKGQIGNSEAAKKAHKNKKNIEEINARAAKTRANWYKNPENKKKFMEAIKRRDKKSTKKRA